MIRQQVKDEYREHRKLLRNIKRVKSINKIKIKDMKTNINIFDEIFLCLFLSDRW